MATLIEGDKMLLHGGINEKEQCFSDAFILVGLHKEIDLSQSEIKFDEHGKIQNIDQLKQRSGKFEMLRWFKCDQDGELPCAMDSHTVTIVNNLIYLFGGQDQNENHLNCLYMGILSQDLI